MEDANHRVATTEVAIDSFEQGQESLSRQADTAAVQAADWNAEEYKTETGIGGLRRFLTQNNECQTSTDTRKKDLEKRKENVAHHWSLVSGLTQAWSKFDGSIQGFGEVRGITNYSRAQAHAVTAEPSRTGDVSLTSLARLVASPEKAEAILTRSIDSKLAKKTWLKISPHRKGSQRRHVNLRRITKPFWKTSPRVARKRLAIRRRVNRVCSQQEAAQRLPGSKQGRL